VATFLIIGLGNPGAGYSANRHNAGFMALDAIAQHYDFPKFKSKFNALYSEGTIDGHKVYLFAPMSFMNLSGNPAGEFARFYKIPTSNIIAIHDELDLPVGKQRVKRGGGHGGHNGLKSLDEHLGQEYVRIRIGIGHPGDKNLVADYVLSDFGKEERSTTDKLLKQLAAHLPLLLKNDEAGFMNKVDLSFKNS
jgi:PTH1 family peptidyl-tRNA hydrolase